MKNSTYAIALLLMSALFTSARYLHETHITIISPKVNMNFKKGQIVNIHFKVRCGEKLKSVTYSIIDQDNKVLLSKSPKVAGKNAIEEKTTWMVTQTAPSVLTLSIEAKDVDGHGSSKLLQFNANF